MVQKATIWMLAAVMCISMMAPLTAAASAEDVERLNKIIEELPAEEDLTGEQADDVKAAMELYQSLTTAEKLEIEGYGKLEKEYETLLSGGLIRDEKKEKEKEQKRQESEQEKLRESESTESESTSYVFNVTDKKQRWIRGCAGPDCTDIAVRDHHRTVERERQHVGRDNGDRLPVGEEIPAAGHCVRPEREMEDHDIRAGDIQPDAVCGGKAGDPPGG